MVWVRTKVRPRAPRRAPKINKNRVLVILEGQMHIFRRFFDGRHCGFEGSLGVLGSSQGRPGGALGAPELALGGLGGVPRERAPHLEAPKGVWKPTLATPGRVHTYQIHIYL